MEVSSAQSIGELGYPSIRNLPLPGGEAESQHGGPLRNLRSGLTEFQANSPAQAFDAHRF